MEDFLRRFAVSSLAGAALFAGTTGGWLVAEKAGVVRRRRPQAGSCDAHEPPLSEVVSIATTAGFAFGGLYAVVRPLLPKQPELSGVLFSFGASFAVRAQLNAFFRFLGREQRFRASPPRIVGDVFFGLWLARAERLLGPRR